MRELSERDLPCIVRECVESGLKVFKRFHLGSSWWAKSLRICSCRCVCGMVQWHGIGHWWEISVIGLSAGAGG